MARTAKDRGEELVIVEEDGVTVVATIRVQARRRLPNGIRVARGIHHGVLMALAWRLDGTLIRALALDAAERAATEHLIGETNFATALQATDSLAIALLALTAAGGRPGPSH